MDATPNEAGRRAALEAAQDRALALFAAIEEGALIAPGRTEREVEDDIYELARSRFGVEKHWHKRIVRAGINTITTAYDDPPVRMIEPDDTVYVDLGPVFEEWEADVGRTYAVGTCEAKRRLVGDLERVFGVVQQRYRASSGITGAELYAFALKAADEAGWAYGGTIAGHTVSEFPHAWIDPNRISPKNPTPMRGTDGKGREKHWILEIHLVDRARTFGGFYEQLL